MSSTMSTGRRSVEHSFERNTLSRRADMKRSAIAREDGQGTAALRFYSLTDTGCGLDVASEAGVATVAADVEPFLNGRSSNE